MKLIYIALGSNLNNPYRQITCAIKELQKLPKSKFINSSSCYLSKPMGPKNQPPYLNAVIALKTNLLPEELLTIIHNIEIKHGRLRSHNNRWGPRPLDIDIILYGNEIIKSSKLIIPHYGIKDRDFVLLPLLEISPNIILPTGELLSNQLISIKTHYLKNKKFNL
uniref:2-amino-4-hydroxy-6-hydroxymethyldihydropteridine pyrophosphokinase n=1 Tax=Candidatus Aschnera chinzeii TaxID=1485666 RepID=A0AAT9G4Q9_9ENTR|nr:MAG: 2-amino-4-hydroxy-6-hydroxymethyldihydropteridine diphosphokinase [Candidatus Aschnera chinzeii]